MICPVLQAFLTGLNYHWTLELIIKLLRPNKADGTKYGKHL